MSYGEQRDIGVSSSGKIAGAIVVALLIILVLVFHQDIINAVSPPAHTQSE